METSKDNQKEATQDLEKKNGLAVILAQPSY